MALAARLLTLRRSPILLKLPPYLSLLCVLVGIAWLLLLPLDEYSRATYISENAILPGQVHTYFGGSEHNVFRAMRQEVYTISQLPTGADRTIALRRLIDDFGLKSAEQAYTFRAAGEAVTGTNVYGVLQAPRADATEAMVLIAAWKNFQDEINYSGVALALTLARYFQRWSIWSKDIILLIPDDSVYGPEAWVSAYHSTPEASSGRNISALPLKSGALQGAIALDYPAGPWGQRFDALDVLYDGINGALPNLDLLNTAVQVAQGHGIRCSLHGMASQADSYTDRLTTIAKGVLSQAAGHATGPHSAFMPYHIDAITLKTVGDGWHDEISLGKVTESLIRSINNLLEHLHQSFFFYILLSTKRFVSIGSYLPAAMLIAGSCTIMALALWLRAGNAAPPSSAAEQKQEKSSDEKMRSAQLELVSLPGTGDEKVLVPKAALMTAERAILLPAVVLVAVHLLSAVPLYSLTHLSHGSLQTTFYALTALSYILAVALSALVRNIGATPQTMQLLQSFSLLVLGAALSTWATLNFSLALVIGLLAAPLSFVSPIRSSSTQKISLAAVPASIIWAALSPSSVALLALHSQALFPGRDLQWLLVQTAWGWRAQGVWSVLLVWAVWWPAWIVAGVVLSAGLV